MHMLHRLRRLAARFLAISLLAATLYAVDSLASPSPAEARCAGVSNEVRSTFIFNGFVRVSETPAPGTCNGNQLYGGIVKDEFADGYCVEVQFKETGIDWTVPAYGSVCGTGHTSLFEWRDRNSNSYVYERLCLWPLGDPSVKICGWGSNLNDYGVNHGF
jgi:hypothetical protein